jgi:hypothetical protein
MAARPQNQRKLVFFGLCMNDLQWKRQRHDHGAALARDLGYTPVYLHYNSWPHLHQRARVRRQLETLLRLWPVPLTDVVLIEHSMGLVARSAFRTGAGAPRMARRVDKLVFLGTPHHGAPVGRGGNWVDILLGASSLPTIGSHWQDPARASPTAVRRSGGEDWNKRDRFARSGDRRVAVPLPEGVACFAIGAATGKTASHLSGRLLGDGIVPLASALGRHANRRLALPFDESRQWVAYGANHLDLLSRTGVYARIKRLLTAAPRNHRATSRIRAAIQ